MRPNLRKFLFLAGGLTLVLSASVAATAQSPNETERPARSSGSDLVSPPWARMATAAAANAGADGGAALSAGDASEPPPAASPEAILAAMWQGANLRAHGSAPTDTVNTGVLSLAAVPGGTQNATAQANLEPASYAIGHYQPSTYSVRDFFLGPTGFAVYLPTYIYHTKTFKDRNGDKVDSISIGQQTIALDVDVTSVVIAPTFAWTSPYQPLGKNSKFGMLIVPSFGNTSIAASLENVAGRGVSRSGSNFGLADLMVQPIRLQWDWARGTLNAGYFFYAPTGSYTKGASDNVGLGFWSNDFQVAGEYKFGKQNGTSLIGAATYEINGNKRDEDFKVGNNLSLNYGLAQYIPVKQGAGLLDLSLTATSVWQVSDDKGADIIGSGDVHDRVHSIGGRFQYIFAQRGLALAANFLQEFGAQARFQGSWYYFSVTQIIPYPRPEAPPPAPSAPTP